MYFISPVKLGFTPACDDMFFSYLGGTTHHTKYTVPVVHSGHMKKKRPPPKKLKPTVDRGGPLKPSTYVKNAGKKKSTITYEVCRKTSTWYTIFSRLFFHNVFQGTRHARTSNSSIPAPGIVQKHYILLEVRC